MENRTPEVLVAERDRLLNSVFHLERTNREIKDLLQESGPDPELQVVVGENIVVIAKYKARIASLGEQISLACGLVTDISSTQKVAIPVDAADPLRANSLAANLTVPGQLATSETLQSDGRTTGDFSDALADSPDGEGLWL